MLIARVCRMMPGWTWEYVEHTVTAARLNALLAAAKPPKTVHKISVEEMRAQFPNGMMA